MENRVEQRWITVERPGFLGAKRDEKIEGWNNQYGVGNWRLRWELKNGQIFDFDKAFWVIYVPGYARHLMKNPDEADYLVDNFSYAFDKDPISKDEAFNPHAFLERPGTVNQFHHVALNYALEYVLGKPFRGDEPIQVRSGSRRLPRELWPLGWRWSPGLIECVRPDLTPEVQFKNVWWREKTIEDQYQRAKVLQIPA